MPVVDAGPQEAFVSSMPASRKAPARGRRDGGTESERVCVL
jgi:hypothetical protein